MKKNGKNKLDVITFSRLYDKFGEQAAKDTLKDVNDGKISAETIDKYLFDDETKEEYTKRLQKEYEPLRQEEKNRQKVSRSKKSKEENDEYDYDYVKNMEDSNATNGVAGLITAGIFLVGAGIGIYQTIKAKRKNKKNKEKR